MTLHDDHPLYQAIATTMRAFTFTTPVEQADLDTVAGYLRAAAPGCAVEVVQPWRDFVRVSVCDPQGLPLFTREYVAVPPR